MNQLGLPRVGIGVDVHPFAAPGSGPALQLAGLAWPGERGLAGHSDGDVVAHAACDALLAAAGLDLGTQFGTDRPSGPAPQAGLAGGDCCTGARRRLPAGQRVDPADRNRPRLGDRRVEAEDVLTAAVGAPVSLSATTTDGLGLTGRDEGLAAVATALVLAGDRRPDEGGTHGDLG